MMVYFLHMVDDKYRRHALVLTNKCLERWALSAEIELRFISCYYVDLYAPSIHRYRIGHGELVPKKHLTLRNDKVNRCYRTAEIFARLLSPFPGWYR